MEMEHARDGGRNIIKEGARMRCCDKEGQGEVGPTLTRL